MRKTIFAIAAVAAGAVAAAAEVAAAESRPEGAAAAETNAMDKAERLRRATGGFVFDKRAAKGRAGFVDAQKHVARAVLEKEAAAIERELMFRVEVSGAEIDAGAGVAEIAKAASASGYDFAVVVADADIPLTLMLAPEQKYAVVNVRELAKDGAAQATLEARVRKELERALPMLFGSGYTVLRKCALSPAASLAELDELPAGRLPTEASSVVQRIATESFGFKLFRRTFYATALREGWAPPPKGEYQRRLWEQVHQIPDKPITIEYDPKKDK